MSWTDERVELLKKLWIDGLSASQIAKQLGSVTRNAVIGKVHRLGLAGRAMPSRPVKRVAVKVKPVVLSVAKETIAKPIAKPVIEDAPAKREIIAGRPVPADTHALEAANKRTHDGALIGVLDLGRNMCKWPIGDPTDPDFGFCGSKTHGDWPYCKDHGEIAYQPQLNRRGPQSNSDKIIEEELKKAV